MVMAPADFRVNDWSGWLPGTTARLQTPPTITASSDAHGPMTDVK